jgi:hypothetical protein
VASAEHASLASSQLAEQVRVLEEKHATAMAEGDIARQREMDMEAQLAQVWERLQLTQAECGSLLALLDRAERQQQQVGGFRGGTAPIAWISLHRARPLSVHPCVQCDPLNQPTPCCSGRVSSPPKCSSWSSASFSIRPPPSLVTLPACWGPLRVCSATQRS